MSGEETDGEPSGREKQLVNVPVQWVSTDLSGLFHTVDTWRSAVADESFMRPRGNRPFNRLDKPKKAIAGKVTNGLPRNWYDDTWYQGRSDAEKLIINAANPRLIPTLVSVCFVFPASFFSHPVSSATSQAVTRTRV
jgi:hypothetical protein